MTLLAGRQTMVYSGYTVLCTAADGFATSGRDGLYHRDTRLLSRYQLTVDGEPPELVGTAQRESDEWTAVYRVRRPGGTPAGPVLPQDILEIRLRRRVASGLLDELVVENHSNERFQGTLRVDADADFRDVAEIESDREQDGRITRDARTDEATLEIRYLAVAAPSDSERQEPADRVGRDEPADPGARGATTRREARRTVRIEAESRPRAVADDGGLCWELAIGPHESWTAAVRVSIFDGSRWAQPSPAEHRRRARQREGWRKRRPTLLADERLRRPFETAADDLFGLRNWELEEDLIGSTDGARWVVNAGMPRFTGLFGRDVLTAGMQSAMLGTRLLRGALDALGSRQATVDDPWHDAEPGKLLHEMRFGPLSELGILPRDAYYGSQTTPAMFVIALSELWHWTGDDEAVRSHLDVARRALEWAAKDGDVDHDDLVEYDRRSPRGLPNQAWKDSDEAIRHADGGMVEGPVATVEEQAFHVLALRRLAELELGVGDPSAATPLLRRAETIRRTWHEAFWMPEEAFYALAIDGEQRQVRSIASNPGHALAAGIVPGSIARRVADRLMADDLFSGWGVRSLSARHPSYNPFAYHLGTVWPIEQATFAVGFKRYGLDDHLDRLVEGMFAAAIESADARLPEAFTGHARGTVPAPLTYPEACSPQAWSASALVQTLQATLGLYPFAPLGLLAIVRPRLPAWLPEVTLKDVRVGRGVVDLTFRRRPDGSARWWVRRIRGPLLVGALPPPEDLSAARPLERVGLAAVNRVPGRLGRSLRISVSGHPDRLAATAPR